MLQALFILLATSNQLQLAESHPPAEPTFFSAIKKYPPPHRETTGASTSLLHEDDLDEQLLSSFPNRRHLSNYHDEHEHDHDTLFVYDRPRPRPKRREDVPPATATNKPILQHESRYINYGEEGHPYERVRRLSHDDNQDGESREEILRNLQGDGLFKPLRIHFDTVSIYLIRFIECFGLILTVTIFLIFLYYFSYVHINSSSHFHFSILCMQHVYTE